MFGVYSLRIENVGVRRPPSDDVQIQGIANPSAFRKVLSSINLFLFRARLVIVLNCMVFCCVVQFRFMQFELGYMLSQDIVLKE